MSRFLKAFLRTKQLTAAEVDETKLQRCLSTLDLTALGVGCTLGAGVYVVTGEVAKNQAGPAIVISFAIAAVASMLSGLCYAEFGARVPRAGSAYIYSYVTIGELCAFVIGWNMLLEYIFGGAAVAKAWSDFFNSICGDCISDFFIKHFGKFKSSFLSDYPDFLAFAFMIGLTIIIICGVAQSSALNWVFTILNLVVILFVTVAGLVYADTKNWNDFAPFGFHGVMSGAAICFFAFVGFDVIATSGEETKTPRKSIPRATVAALLIVFVAYECISVTLTLMLPYNKLPAKSALATAFDRKGLSAAKYIVAIGAICGITASALDGLYPIPRIIYSMASDRLIFTFFAKVSERTGTPAIACATSGILTALFALLFDLKALTEMLSIGTLLSYTIVSMSVLLLRYKPGCIIRDAGDAETARTYGRITDPHLQNIPQEFGEHSEIIEESGKHSKTGKGYGSHSEIRKEYVKHFEPSDNATENLLNAATGSNNSFSKPSIVYRISRRILGGRLDNPTEDSYLLVKFSLSMFILHTIGLQSCLVWGMDRLASKDPLIIVFFVYFLIWILLAIVVIARQPESKNKLFFKVPFLPYLPLSAVFVNLFLLLELSYLTWIRFAAWMIIGMTIYLFYGVKNSVENEDRRETRPASYTEISEQIED